MNDQNNLETTVKVPAFDDATIAALLAQKTLDADGNEILVQTDEDFGTEAETPTVH